MGSVGSPDTCFAIILLISPLPSELSRCWSLGCTASGAPQQQSPRGGASAASSLLVLLHKEESASGAKHSSFTFHKMNHKDATTLAADGRHCSWAPAWLVLFKDRVSYLWITCLFHPLFCLLAVCLLASFIAHLCPCLKLASGIENKSPSQGPCAESWRCPVLGVYLGSSQPCWRTGWHSRGSERGSHFPRSQSSQSQHSNPGLSSSKTCVVLFFFLIKITFLYSFLSFCVCF